MPLTSFRSAGSKTAARRSTASAGSPPQQAEELGRLELEETKIGRLDHKIEKLKIVKLVPGVEFLKTDCMSGDHGLTLTEYAPFGVIGAITPVTHSLPTLAGNAISMIAGGNTLVVNAHPGGARIAAEGVKRFNKAIYEATRARKPDHHRRTADARNGRRDLSAPRRAPVVRDWGTGRRPRRARKPQKGRSLPAPAIRRSSSMKPPVRTTRPARSSKGGRTTTTCCASARRKSSPSMRSSRSCSTSIGRNGGYQLGPREIEQLTALAFKPGKDHPLLNRDLIGKDARVLAELIGVRVPAGTQLLYGETDESNPFVSEEQMMPFVPFVRVRDFRQGLELAKKHEHNFRHTAHHPFAQRPQHDDHGARDGYDALHQERPLHGGTGSGGRRLPVVQHRHADRRRGHQPAHFHPPAPLHAGR